MSGKKYRKLIGEIVEVLQHIHKAGTDGELPEEGSDVYAEQFITRILKAVVDGELDEALGVVGRRDLGASPYAPTEWAWTMIGKGARTFIALSPQEEK